MKAVPAHDHSNGGVHDDSPTGPYLPPHPWAANRPPGRHAPALDALPDDVGTLAEVVRGLLIHGSWLHLYGLVPDDMPVRSRETLPVAQRLDALLAGSTGPLWQERPPRLRAVATCRDYALMLCAFLRQKGVPARVRCGFAQYFKADHHEDHWVCEYWDGDETRWAVADAQLDAEHRAHLYSLIYRRAWPALMARLGRARDPAG